MLVTTAKEAGSTISMQCRLGSDQAQAICATGYPKSAQIACASTALVDGIEQTVTVGGAEQEASHSQCHRASQRCAPHMSRQFGMGKQPLLLSHGFGLFVVAVAVGFVRHE